MRIIKCEENRLEFDSGVIIEAEHSQDCCEHVYADFEHLKTYNVLPHTGEKISIFNINFPDDIQFDWLKGEGFCLIASDESKWFVPCYNSQNGYYSSNLELRIKEGRESKVVDISDFVKDQID